MLTPSTRGRLIATVAVAIVAISGCTEPQPVRAKWRGSAVATLLDTVELVRGTIAARAVLPDADPGQLGDAIIVARAAGLNVADSVASDLVDSIPASGPSAGLADAHPAGDAVRLTADLFAGSPRSSRPFNEAKARSVLRAAVVRAGDASGPDELEREAQILVWLGPQRSSLGLVAVAADRLGVRPCSNVQVGESLDDADLVRLSAAGLVAHLLGERCDLRPSTAVIVAGRIASSVADSRPGAELDEIGLRRAIAPLRLDAALVSLLDATIDKWWKRAASSSPGALEMSAARSVLEARWLSGSEVPKVPEALRALASRTIRWQGSLAESTPEPSLDVQALMALHAATMARDAAGPRASARLAEAVSGAATEQRPLLAQAMGRPPAPTPSRGGLQGDSAADRVLRVAADPCAATRLPEPLDGGEAIAVDAGLLAMIVPLEVKQGRCAPSLGRDTARAIRAWRDWIRDHRTLLDPLVDQWVSAEWDCALGTAPAPASPQTLEFAVANLQPRPGLDLDAVYAALRLDDIAANGCTGPFWAEGSLAALEHSH